jgi:hypothetical protein
MDNVVGGALKLKKPIGGITKKWARPAPRDTRVASPCCWRQGKRPPESPRNTARLLPAQEEEERCQGRRRRQGASRCRVRDGVQRRRLRLSAPACCLCRVPQRILLRRARPSCAAQLPHGEALTRECPHAAWQRDGGGWIRTAGHSRYSDGLREKMGRAGRLPVSRKLHALAPF